MAKRRLYRFRKKKKLNDTSTFYVSDDEVPEGYTLFVTTGSVEDETTAATTLSFGIRFENDVYIPLEEQSSPTAGLAYHISKTHTFNPGERPTCRVEGGTVNDIIRVYFEGYMVERAAEVEV